MKNEKSQFKIEKYLNDNKQSIINNIKTNSLNKEQLNVLNKFIIKTFNQHYYIFKSEIDNDEILSIGWISILKNINNINSNINFDIYLYTNLRRSFAKFIYEEKQKTTQYFKYFNSSLLNSIATFYTEYYNNNNSYPTEDIIINKFNIEKSKSKYIIPEVERILFMLSIREESINNIQFDDKNKIFEEISSKAFSENIEDKIFIKEISKIIYDLIEQYLDERNQNIYISKLPIDRDGNLKTSKTLQEIGKEYGLSKERIRQIIKSADKKIKVKVQQVLKTT
jgi:RNA polymerase sigma factor (sigma-70 family)